MDNPLYVGIELGNEYSQVSFYNFKEKEPTSVDFSGMETRFQIPTVISKTIGREQWFFGEEAKNSADLNEAVLVEDLLQKAYDREPVNVDDISMMPVELLRIFLDNLLQAVTLASGMNDIAKICITLQDFHIGILNIISEAVQLLGIPKDLLILSGKEESFVYYALSQSRDLWANDVVLFDFDEKGLKFYRLYIVTEHGMRIVMTHEENLEEEIPYVLVGNTSSAELLDARLTEAAHRLLDHHTVSTVYLTGKGFEGELHIPDFIKFLCDRRRVFAGQNLYTKGACYEAYETGPDKSDFKDLIIACPQRITTGVEIKIESKGRDKILRLVKAGTNWYGADVNADFIVDDAREMELFLSPIDSKEKQIVRISLDDFPQRPNKATRISLKLSFTGDSRAHLMILDRGFGDFYPSSGRVITEELLL